MIYFKQLLFTLNKVLYCQIDIIFIIYTTVMRLQCLTA